MTFKNLSIAFCVEPDENSFKFKIIFATGVTVDRHHEDNDIYIKRYTMMPIYVAFNEHLFMFQQILVYGKDFEVIENEQFLKMDHSTQRINIMLVMNIWKLLIFMMSLIFLSH